MNNFSKSIAMGAIVLMPFSAKAFSFKDFLKSDEVKDVVTNVTGGQQITAATISGRWNYSKPAVKLKSDSAITEAASAVATSTVEDKIEGIFAKVGITTSAFSFTFNSDNSFSCNAKGKTLSGTYTLNSAEKTIELQFAAFGSINIGKMNAAISLLGNSLTLLFKADSLLDLVTKIASSSENANLQSISKLAEQYNGVELGFELNK